MTEDIITQVITAGAKKLEEITATFMENPTRLDRFNLDIRESVLQMGVEYIGNVLTMMNQSLKDNTVRKAKGWNVIDKSGPNRYNILKEHAALEVVLACFFRIFQWEDALLLQMKFCKIS